MKVTKKDWKKIDALSVLSGFYLCFIMMEWFVYIKLNI